MNLLHLEPSRTYLIKEIFGSDQKLKTLSEIGISKGEQISFLFKSPLGDPIAFYICGAIVALRKEDCVNILTENR